MRPAPITPMLMVVSMDVALPLASVSRLRVVSQGLPERRTGATVRGDTTFAVGAVALGWFVVGLRTGLVDAATGGREQVGARPVGTARASRTTTIRAHGSGRAARGSPTPLRRIGPSSVTLRHAGESAPV